MLRAVADAVKKEFGSSDSFRVGGDEYVAFAVDSTEEEVSRKVRALCGAIKQMGYHAAVGYECSEIPEIDMNSLIVKAESRMYRDKSDYYSKNDRRART